MNHTGIEWTTYTWNPVTGCSPISAGCDHCYARRMAYRLRGRCGYPSDDPFRITFHPDRLDEPLKLKKPSLIFVCSMGDLFHRLVEHEWRLRVFEAMANASHHHYLILTKRPRLARVFFQTCEDWDPTEWPNVWLGVTAENQATADKRIPQLFDIPAAGHFISVEPMLGPIDMARYLDICGRCPTCQHWELEANYDVLGADPGHVFCNTCHAEVEPDWRDGLDWVICGGETGPGARPMDSGWARDLRDQCRAADVPFFFKRMGNKRETPDDLKVREMPSEITKLYGGAHHGTKQ